MQSTAQIQRDEAIQRAGLTRRAAIGGATALTAGIAAFVSAVAPGKTFGASRTFKTTVAAAPASTARSATSTPQMPALASPSELGLATGSAPGAAPSQQPQVQPPPVQQAPVQQAPVQQAPVVSGGS